ncbi:MAG: hypothetical protein Q8O59_04115 [bacterium]|nr:hypothetical protein [bacterium]
MAKRNLLIALAVFFLMGLFFLGLNLVNAGTGLTITPVKISQTLKPGEAVSGVISLTNVSEKAIRVDVKMEDFIPLAGGEGVQFVGRAPGLSTVRDWITIGGEQSFTFGKNESKDIPYTIKAPLTAEPGSHFGVAFFKATELQDGGQLKIGTQVGVLIFVTVPGNRLQKGKILDFTAPRFVQKGPVNFKIKFANTGTVHFEPKGEIKITNIFGKEVGKVPIAGQVVLPTGAKDLQASWNVAGLLLGRYKAAASIQDGEGNILTTNNIAFYAFPLWYLLGFILLVIIIFFILKFLRSKISISIVKK